MATVTLDRLWLHDANNLASYLTFFTGDRKDSRASQGEVRKYANGRLRAVVRSGSMTTIGATLRMVTDANLAQLDAWRGKLLMLRDHRGRLLFGVFFSVDIGDYDDRSGYDVSLTFSEVSWDIEV